MGPAAAALIEHVRLFDTHCHLTWHMDEDPVAERLQRAGDAGVASIMTVGVDAESSRLCRDLAREHEQVFASVGIHPNDWGEAEQFDSKRAEVEQIAADGGFHAIGETGLDFFRDWCPQQVQRDGFQFHLDLARELDLPLIIHCRDAGDAVLEVLRAQQREVRGIMHCFAEGPEKVDAFLDLGMHISFAGNVTYPKSQHLRDAAGKVPKERILVETDAPFLSPQPKRGKRNEPAYVAHTLQCIADCHGVNAEAMAEQTYQNAAELFAVDPGSSSTISPDA